MIKLPDFNKSFEYENNFYLSCDGSRITKLMSHYELYKLVMDLPGVIIECGVFKGASFARWAMFRNMFRNYYSHKLIGFDTFGKFPETEYKDDKKVRQNFIDNAGDQSISKNQLMDCMLKKDCAENIQLIEGDICETVPSFLQKHPETKIALLNLDTDIYEPAVTILEHLWPRIVKGGILIIDDYGVFPGETKAVDDFFKDKEVTIKKFPWASSPCYVIKQ